MARSLGFRLLLALLAWTGLLAAVELALGAPAGLVLGMGGLVAVGAVFLLRRGALEVAEAGRQARSLVSHPSADPLVLPVPAELEPMFEALVELKRDSAAAHGTLERERERQQEWTELFSRSMVALQADLALGVRFQALLQVLSRHAGVDAGGYYAVQSSVEDVREVAWCGTLPALPADALVKGRQFRDVASGRVLWVEDLEITEAVAVLQEFAAHRGFRSIVVVPSLWDDQVVGWLLLFHREPRPMDGCVMSVLKALRAPMGRAQHAGQCFQQILEQQRRLLAAHEMVTAAGGPVEGFEMAARILERVRDLQPYHRGSLLLADGHEGFVSYSTGVAGDSSSFLGSRLRREGSCAAMVCESQVFRIDADLAEARVFREDRVLVESGYRSRLAIPLVVGRRVVGCVYLVSREAGAFTAEVAEELQAALQLVAIVLEARSRPPSEGGDESLEPEAMERARQWVAMGHELGGQLRGVLETAQSLARGDLAMPVNKANEMAAHLRGIIAQLEGSRQVAGSPEDVESLHLEEVVVDDVVRDASFNVSSRFKARRIRFASEIPPDFPRIAADPGHLRSALYHVLERAAESTPVGGRVSLRASFVPALAFEHMAARLMPASVVEAIGSGVNVALFSVVDEGGALDAEGLGGGWEIAWPEWQFVERLVDMHRGHAWVEVGPEGRGNRVGMAFPQYGPDQVTFLHRVGRRLAKAREGGQSLAFIGVAFKERRSLRAATGEERFKQAMRELEGAIGRAVRGPDDATRRFHNDEMVVIVAETDRAGVTRMVERVRARLAHYVLPALKRTADLATCVVCYPEDAVRAEDIMARLVEAVD